MNTEMENADLEREREAHAMQTWDLAATRSLLMERLWRIALWCSGRGCRAVCTVVVFAFLLLAGFHRHSGPEGSRGS